MIFEALDIHTHLNARTCYLRLKFARFARRSLFAPDMFLNIKCTKYWTLIDLNPFASIMSYLYYATKRHEQTVVLGECSHPKVARLEEPIRPVWSSCSKGKMDFTIT